MTELDNKPSAQDFFRIRKALIESAQNAALTGVGLSKHRTRFHTIVNDPLTGYCFGGDVLVRCPAFRSDGTLVLKSSLRFFRVLREGYLLPVIHSVIEGDPKAVAVLNGKIVAKGTEVSQSPVPLLFADFVSRRGRRK